MCCACTGLVVDRLSRYYKGIPEECSRERYSVTQYRVVISNCLYLLSYGAFTPEQDNDKTTTRQLLNLCIPMIPFTPDMSDLVWKAS